jgi:hypothetical protein
MAGGAEGLPVAALPEELEVTTMGGDVIHDSGGGGTEGAFRVSLQEVLSS